MDLYLVLMVSSLPLKIRWHGNTLSGGKVMEAIVIPRTEEILKMSRMRCQQERIRLKNEISFARGDETTGGPSSKDRLLL
jgi:hypothetical protein